MTPTALTTTDRASTTTDIMTAFGAFLRLYVADRDTSPETIRSYRGNAAQFVAWCGEHGINPATFTEDNIATYRRELLAQYEVSTVAVKLAAIRRLYEAAVWRGLKRATPPNGLWRALFAVHTPRNHSTCGEGACRPIGRREMEKVPLRNPPFRRGTSTRKECPLGTTALHPNPAKSAARHRPT